MEENPKMSEGILRNLHFKFLFFSKPKVEEFAFVSSAYLLATIIAKCFELYPIMWP